MTPHFTHKAPQAGNRWLWPLLPSILVAVSPIATVEPIRLAAATDFPITEDGCTIQSAATWKGTTSSILPLTITPERNIYEGLAPSSVRERAPHMTSGRIGCAIGKTQGKARRHSMHVSALPYNGTKQVLSIRRTPTEIGVSLREKSAAIIGPVQEIRKPILSHERLVSQTVAALPSTVDSTPLFGSQPIGALNRFPSALQEPNNESHRMDLTTAQALHGGNCPNGCP
jgi:hypothetical protein